MPILSIQSHVCYGHVGNSAAIFPLQRLGYDVWPVHGLQFSNHPGYGDWAGEVFAAGKVIELLEAIERQGAFKSCEAVLSGYLGTAAHGRAILEAVAAVRIVNPDTVFLCDPVMGDQESGLYVESDIPAFMREEALTSADIITPNLFELGLLVGQELRDSESARNAARDLIEDPDNRLKVVIVSSLPARGDRRGEEIGVLAVTERDARLALTSRLGFETPVKGSGDCFSALFLAAYLRNANDIGQALQEASAALYAIIAETHRRGSVELCLVEAQAQIAHPPLEQVELIALPD